MRLTRIATTSVPNTARRSIFGLLWGLETPPAPIPQTKTQKSEQPSSQQQKQQPGLDGVDVTNSIQTWHLSDDYHSRDSSILPNTPSVTSTTTTGTYFSDWGADYPDQ